jgi:hypothetical protein
MRASHSLSSIHLPSCLRLAFGLALFLGASAGAQNYLKNGDFEQAPLGPTNWTVGYLHGGPDDWEIKDRNRGGSRRASQFYGGYLRVLTLKLAHAYFTQTVTNLQANHEYSFVGHMREDWWKAANDALRDKYLVYIEVIGGQGTPTTDGRYSVIATNDLTNSSGDADTNIDYPYTYATYDWRPFYAKQTPDAQGKIEVRLHYNKISFTIYDKTWISAASYDDCALTY